MADNTFSRLEAREILHNLKSTCDPDVIQKLADLAGINVVMHDEPAPKAAERSPVPRNASPEVLHAIADAEATAGQEPPQDGLPTDDSWRFKWEPWMGERIDPKTGKPWCTREEADTIDRERAVALIAAHQMSSGIPYSKAAPPELPAGHGIDRIPLGVRNKNNDMCIALRDPATGIRYVTKEAVPDTVDKSTLLSIFKCAKDEEHGFYEFSNPNIKSCTRCFMSGGGDRSSSADTHGGHSTREEQF